MGILDSKTRIMDTLITQEGRKQIASAKLKVEWVSFSDASTFYEADAISGSSDATSRLYLEACSLPQDQITFEADDSGRLAPFKNDKNLSLMHGKIFSSSMILTGAFDQDMQLIENDQFASFATTLLSSSLDNFKNNYPITTTDFVFDETVFAIGPKTISYIITDEIPKPDPRTYSANVNHLESFFQDRRLSHIDNFMYLPPISKLQDTRLNPTKPDDVKDYRLGDYPNIGQARKFTYEDFESEFSSYEKMGYCKTIKFDPTSRNNKIMMQFFEIGKNEISKLDVIDFGKHSTDDAVFSSKRVFFAGKVIEDDNGNHTFLHVFTLVME